MHELDIEEWCKENYEKSDEFKSIVTIQKEIEALTSAITTQGKIKNALMNLGYIKKTSRDRLSYGVPFLNAKLKIIS